MTVLAAPSPVTPGDRLAMATCLALIFHALLILGVGFAPEEPPVRRFDTMEIVLVQQRGETPDDAELLAQADLEGGADSAEDGRPATPLPSPMPALEAEVVLAPPPAPQPAPQAAPAQAAPPAPPAPQARTTAPPAQPAPRIMAADAVPAEQPQPAERESAPPPAEQPDAGEAPAAQAAAPAPSADQLIASSFAIASLSAEIQERLDAKSQRLRRKFISASTREYKFAAYMEAWRAKVERVGNLNYPDAARREHLSGSLILEVVLQPDGKVREIIVRRSSGHAVLDDAAQRIVRLAAPFAAFPPDIAKEIDLLHVTRTWQFLDSAQFRSK